MKEDTKSEKEKIKGLERVLKALANRRRLTILVHLRQHHTASVGGVSRAIKLSLKSTSKHLNLLANCDLVEKEQKRLNVYYSLFSPPHPLLKLILSDL